MQSFAEYIQSIRIENSMSVKAFAAAWSLHPSLISRFEKGERMPTTGQLEAFIGLFDLDEDLVLKKWYAEKVVGLVQYASLEPLEILELAETRIEYLNSTKVFDLPDLSKSVRLGLEKLDDLHKKWNSLKPLTGIRLEKMQAYFSDQYTFESNRIEGNTLTLMETSLVINEGLTVSGKSMREHLEAINHAEATEYLKSLVSSKEELNKRVLLELHSLVLRGIDRENAGKYRSIPVRIRGSKHTPPQPYLIDKLMEDYFIHYSQNRKVLHPVILAAEMHERLVTIHPFVDGNGRSSRLIMNLILLQNGYTITILQGDLDARNQYFNALEKVQVDADPEPFYQLIIDRCIASMEEHIELAS